MPKIKLTANPPRILKSGDASVIEAVLSGFDNTPLPREIKFIIKERYPFLLHANQRAALKRGSDLKPVPELTVTVDENGRASALVFSLDKSGVIKVVAEVPGNLELRSEVALDVADSASLTGMVLDKDRKPISGLKITLRTFKDYESPENPQTAVNGKYEFHRLIASEYTVTAEKDGKKKTDEVDVRKANVVHDIIFE
jgi:hypothetical protein